VSGFVPDKHAARRFERRFLPLTITGLVVAFGGSLGFMYLSYRAQQSQDKTVTVFICAAFASMLIGQGMCFLSYRRILHTAPISPQSGKPMEVYQLQDTADKDRLELIYLCRESHTYFRRVFREPG
jgi:hypothetical protein